MPPSRARLRLTAGYFVFQGLAIPAWWLLLALAPAARMPFLPTGSPPSALLAFALPDLALLTVGSLLTGVLTARDHRWALPLAWLVAGAVDYATLHLLAWSTLTGNGWAGVLAMGPAALLSTVFALELASWQLPVYRKARAASATANVAKTLSQIVVFWTLFLAVVPLLLVRIEAQLGLARVAWTGQVTLAAIVFVALSALGLQSGITMARRGEGTPLPLDAPRRLVIAGPYAYVRNPMAIAGLGQGLCVGVGLGSGLVVGYVLLGAAIWNWIVRPSEEADLERGFGEAFVRYRSVVRCWVPRLHRYQGESDSM